MDAAGPAFEGKRVLDRPETSGHLVATNATAGSAALLRRAESIWAVAILALTAWFYVWTATSAGSPLTFKLQKDDLYNRLADGFLAGELGFLEAPNPALAQLPDPWDPAQNGPLRQYHDVSYYRGKYYLYFGPAPAVLLLAPWKALTGTYLPQNLAAAIFGWLGVAASMGLVLVLRRRYFPATPSWISGLCLLAAAFGNFVPVLLRRPVYYELAIASAYAFAMTALFGVTLALNGGARRRLWLMLAGLAYGLAVASRPNYVFGAVVLAAPLLPAWRAWRARVAMDWRPVMRDALSAGLPLLGIISLLLLYNWRRFDRWTEFGTSYMFSGLHPQRDVRHLVPLRAGEPVVLYLGAGATQRILSVFSGGPYAMVWIARGIHGTGERLRGADQSAFLLDVVFCATHVARFPFSHGIILARFHPGYTRPGSVQRLDYLSSGGGGQSLHGGSSAAFAADRLCGRILDGTGHNRNTPPGGIARAVGCGTGVDGTLQRLREFPAQ